MPTYNEQLQKVYHLYEAQHENDPVGTRDVVDWAIKNELMKAPDVDPLAKLAGDMADALRAEYRVDSKGRRYRANHAVRVSQRGIQYTLWRNLDKAPREFMEKAFSQRRRQVVGDCLQLRTDVDAYNDHHHDNEPIPLELDFTRDVEELQLGQSDEAA